MEVNTQAMEFRKALLKFTFQELTDPVRNHAFEYLKSKTNVSNKNTLVSAIVANMGSSKSTVSNGQTVVVGLKDQLNPLKKNLPGTDYQHFLSSSDDDFKTIFRMSRIAISKLVCLVKKRETDTENTDLRYISTKKRVHITVWMLGNRESLATTAAMFGVLEEALCKIFLSTCKEISQFAHKYIQWPSAQDRELITKSFQSTHGFPGVVGIIGYCHQEVSLPAGTPEEERFWSMDMETQGINLQIIVDDKMLIRDAFVDVSGESNIVNTFQTSPIYSWLLNDLSDPIIGVNEHLLGNSDFPQLTNLLTPYTHETNDRPITEAEEEFNAIHTSACSVVELTLETLKSRLERFNLLDITGVDSASNVAFAVCVLHNFTILYDDIS